MAGDRPDRGVRIVDALQRVAVHDGALDAPPPELWSRIAGAVERPEVDDADLTPPPPALWAGIEAEVAALAGPAVASPAPPLLTELSPPT